MNTTRVNEIKNNFTGIGPNSMTLYTNQEIVDKLMELQSTMANGVFEKTHAEHMRERDVLLHFATLAEEYGVKDTDTFGRFEENMKELSYTIGSFVKGMNGEKIAKRTSKLLSFDKNVKILYNVALEDEDAQAEYDAIAITPYGMFVIEVKNWGSQMYIDERGILTREDQKIRYDLPGRMSIKEGLLRVYLGNQFPERFQGIVLLTHENVEVEDNYKQIPICKGGIVYDIRGYDDGVELLSAEQIQSISDEIMKYHKEQRALCKVKCNEIIEDFAILMSAIEEASDETCEPIIELQKDVSVITDKVQTKEKGTKKVVVIPKCLAKTDAIPEQDIKETVYKVAELLIAVGIGAMAGKALGRKK